MAHQQGPGIYYDGKASAPHAVTLTLEDTAVAIVSQAGAPVARWDYAEIKQLPAPPDRLRFALPDSPSTSRLEVRDRAFADALKAHLGLDTPEHTAKERRRRRLVVVWSAAAVAAVVTIAIAGLPALAGLLAPFVPHATEMRIGNLIHERELASYTKIKGPLLCGDESPQEKAGKAAFMKMLGQLEAVANLPIPIKTYIIRSKIPNAGAIPGGILHFNLGIIELSESPEELAGVMGHEIGHLVHRHGLTGYLHRLGLTFLVAMSAGDIFTGVGVQIAATGDLHRRNSRAQERQADTYGVETLAKLGADTHAAADLWERFAALEAKFQKNMPPRSLLSYTHPASLERAAAIRATPKVPNPKPLISAEEWKALKQVCAGG